MKPILNSKLWHQVQDCWSAGFVHAANGSYYEGKQLTEYINHIKDETALANILKQSNGCFGFICRLENTYFACTDVVRSYPLFYLKTPSGVNLSDNTENIIPLCKHSMNDTPGDILAEYLLTGYVTGSDTLIPQLYQIPAGCYLKWSIDTEPQLVQYYSFVHTEPETGNPQEYLTKLDSIHLALAQRLATSLQGRTAVVPLSGGHDSRLIAWLLKRVNYPKVLCFSYGAPKNPESRISKAAAAAMGWDWRFIPHSRSSWYKAYNSTQRKDFYRYSINASAIPHLQDWLAVKVLREQKLVPQNAVFIPGHSGDFLAGSHLPPVYKQQQNFTKAELIDQIIKAHYNTWNCDKTDHYEAIATRIGLQLAIPERMNAPTAASLFEEWDWAERQAKSVIASLRVYEFFGYDWRIPLWDRDLMDFWCLVPLKLRLNRYLWQQYQSRFIKIPVPYFSKPPITVRLVNKIAHCTIGNAEDARYGRYTPYRSFCQFTNAGVGSIMNPSLKYPEFIDPKQPLLKTTLNALEALVSISQRDA